LEASASIIKHKYIQNICLKQQNNPLKWNTTAGELHANHQVIRADIEFTLPELYESRMVLWTIHVTEMCGSCDFLILGSDIVQALGVTFSFSNCTTTCDDSYILMKQSSTRNGVATAPHFLPARPCCYACPALSSMAKFIYFYFFILFRTS
jgi:hypothetical protein